MGKKLTQEEFIQKAKEIHRDKYDYSKVHYINNHTNVCIICPEHGEFWQTPKSHLKGCECPQCAKENRANKKTLSFDEFFKKANLIHCNKYNYDKAKNEYVNTNTKIDILCPIHGYFSQNPSCHLKGQGCPKCGLKKRAKSKCFTTKIFINKAKEIYGDKYDYSKVEYKGNNEKVCIICPKHGEFWQIAETHLQGHECPKCGIEASRKKRLKNTDDFIDKAKEIHGEKYDYSKVEYKGRNKKVSIICPVHREFKMIPYNHLIGQGCPKCKYDKLSQKYRKTNYDFIEKSKEIHGEKYDYSKVKYVNRKTKVCIICPKHGEFWQEADSHTRGEGCPKCAVKISKAEDEIADYLRSLGIENIERRNRIILKGKEIDIYLPDYHIGIEYDGINWHGEKHGKEKWYHLDKTRMCNENGIRLIHIFEDEYILRKDIVLHKLKHILHRDKDMPKIGGRKCEIRKINYDECKPFMDKFHIQGIASASVYLGCFFENKMIASMTFIKRNNKYWELNRFASDYNYIIQGCGGKLLKYFIVNYNPNEIISFADVRWVDYNSNIYDDLGFIVDKILSPDYAYVKPNIMERIHKFNCRKEKLHQEYGLSLDMTEKEMIDKLGYDKIWNCGLIRYKWLKNG